MSKKTKTIETTSAASPLLMPLSIVLALLPVIMFPYASDTYALPKATFLYAATLALAFVYFVYAVRAGELIIHRSPLDIPVVLILAVAALSTVFSDAPALAIVGKYKHYENLLAFFCYGALYFLSVQVVRNRKDFEQLLSILTVGSIPVIFYGILQIVGIDFPTVARFESRVHSSLGNPILLGTYLVVLLPLLVSQARNSESERWRFFSWLLVFLGIINLIYTWSRGAWLGLLAAATVLLVARSIKSMQVSKSKRSKRRHPKDSRNNPYIVFGLIGIFLLAITFLAGTENSFKTRALSTFSFSDGSVATRIETWKASFDMIADRPVSGYGLEQMGYWFPEYKTATHVKLDPNGIADRAHNDFIQSTVDFGLLGLVLYIWMFAIALFALFKRGTVWQKAYLTGISAAVIGYIAQAQTGITAIFITPLLWSLLAAAVNLSASVKERPSELKLVLPKWATTQPLVITLGIAAFAISAVSVRPVIADTYIYKAKAQAAQSIELAAPEFEAALQIFPYQNEYAKLAAEFYLTYASATQDSVFARRASLIAEEGIRYNKRDFELVYYVAEANFLDYHLGENEFALAKAEDYYKRADRLWPSLSLTKRSLFEIALIRNQTGRAVSLAQTLVSSGYEDPILYYTLALEAQKSGKSDKAASYFKKIEQLDPDFLSRTETAEN